MGSDINTGTLAKLKEVVPHQIGDNRRWSEDIVNTLVTFVAGIAAERIGFVHVTTEIALIPDQLEYSLPTNFISVTRAEYNPDSADAREIMPATLRDFDNASGAWRNTRGLRPEQYALVGTPGSPDCVVYFQPVPSAAGDVKLTGVGTTSDEVMDDVQDKFLVPYVLSLLYAGDELDLTMDYYNEAMDGADDLRRLYADETMEGI